MTVAATPRKARFLGNDVATSFPFSFRAFAASDLVVTLTSSDGVEVPLILNDDYTVSLDPDQENNPGGSLTYPVSGSPLATGQVLTAISAIEESQETDLQNRGAFLPQVIEDRFDYLTVLVQQLSERLSRVAFGSASDSDPVFSLGTAGQRANKYISFDADGNLQLVTSIGTTPLSQALIGQHLYPLSSAEAIANVTAADVDMYRPYDDIRRYRVVANGTDQYAKILKAMNVLSAAGGGLMRFPYMGDSGIGLTETIQPYDNVTLQFEGTYLKLLTDTLYDSAITPQPGARNVTIINPLIDCNSIPAGCGIIARRNNTDMTVIGGTVKNAVHHTTDKGGRALNIEAGVDPTLEGPRNLRVFGLLARNCYEACSVSGGDTASFQNESNIRIDMLAVNCESLLSLFGNTANYPHSADEMGCHITMTARNCGKAATYSRVHGVVNSDRGCNALIDVQVENDAAYGSVGSLWRGDASGIKFSGKMTGACSRALLDFASYQEVNAISEAATWTTSGSTLSSLDSDFEVKHSGTVADVFNLPIISADFLKNCRFNIVTDVVTTGKPGNSNTTNKTTCFARVQNKTQNAIVLGYLSDIDAMTFAQAANLEFDASKQGPKSWGVFAGASGTLNRGFNCSVSRVSTGVYDVTFSVKPPGGGTSYVILPASQAASASNQVDDYSNITNNGFRITTYSGGAVSDKALAGFVVLW